MIKKRMISSNSLLFASISAIIGSGWLFTAYYTSILAGPASFVSWIIGGVAVMLVAFTFAELSAFLPITGATIRVPRYTHGVLVGFVFSWILWLSYVALAVVEVQAMIQYASFFFPGLVYATGALTFHGYIWATVLMVVVTTLNLYSLRWLIRCNDFLTILKLLIPIIVAVAIIVTQFSHFHLNVHDVSRHVTFMPHGIHGVFAAITSGGIIFAFNGFKQASEMAGEAANPHRALPRAIIGSVLICLVIFLCLQLAFLSTIHNDQQMSIWESVKIGGVNSPFAVILSQQHLKGLLPLLYIGAIVGPFAASLMYSGSAARALYAISKNDCLPASLGSLTQAGIPFRAIMINFCLGMFLFAPFPGWNSMANFLTSLMALSYAIAPVTLLTLRKHLPNQELFFKLPCASLWCFVAFYICSLLFYWSGWLIVSRFYVALLLGLVILMGYRLYNRAKGIPVASLNWKISCWIWPYFIGMTILSYYGTFGGKGCIPFGVDFVLVAALALLSLWLSVRFSFDTETIKAHIDELKKSVPTIH